MHIIWAHRRILQLLKNWILVPNVKIPNSNFLILSGLMAKNSHIWREKSTTKQNWLAIWRDNVRKKINSFICRSFWVKTAFTDNKSNESTFYGFIPSVFLRSLVSIINCSNLCECYEAEMQSDLAYYIYSKPLSLIKDKGSPRWGIAWTAFWVFRGRFSALIHSVVGHTII